MEIAFIPKKLVQGFDIPPGERFWPMVQKTDTHWYWTGGTGTNGYGSFWDGTKLVGAHVFAYTSLVGPVPQGLVLDHVCRIRHCVNPACLEPVTQGENALRGFSPPAINARKTHCIRGHELAGTRVHISKEGWRECRECNNYRAGQQDRQSLDVVVNALLHDDEEAAWKQLC